LTASGLGVKAPFNRKHIIKYNPPNIELHKANKIETTVPTRNIPLNSISTILSGNPSKEDDQSS
jgi:hypothetical protein